MKYIILILLFFALATSASAMNFGTVKYITGATSATTSVLSVTPATSQVLTYDAFGEGQNQKVDTGYLLLAQVASSSASKIGLTISYSQNGYEWYNNNLASTTASNIIALDAAPTYSLLGNAVSSTTRVALKLETPTRFTRVTFSSLVATSGVWAVFLPVVSL